MKIVFRVLVALALLSILVSIVPVNAWIYPDGTTKYEKFGPRAKKLLVKMYPDDTALFEALKAGDLDIVDWPLSKEVYDDITANYPGIQTVSYGPEFGIFIVDLNSNNNEYLGNPAYPVYPNPQYPNPMSDVWLRRAIAHLVDRPEYIANPSIGAGFGLEMYTTIPAAMSKYLLEVYGNTTFPWSWDYNPPAAEALLDAHGFGTEDGEGYRIWDATGERAEIIFYARSDHPGRLMIGNKLYTEMDAIGLYVDYRPATSGTCFVDVMVNKDFHMYTGGWSLGSNPEHLILWSWDYYWHPGFCYNYGGHNDPDFNAAAEGIMYANTQEEAVYWAMIAQYYQCLNVLGIPIYCVSGIKAYSKTYVGEEAPYTGANWCGVGNTPGYGIDNGYTFMNMYPEGYPQAVNPDMTIRCGMKVPELKQLNIIYASWLYDYNVLGMVYFDSLMASEQYDVGSFFGWACRRNVLDTYAHPTLGTCTRVSIVLRDDMFWHDGNPITTADVFFSFVEIKQILERRGLPPPWWCSSLENILSFSIIDPYNFEVLLDVKSFWALNWIAACCILPKHIWKPICEEGDPQAFCPDPHLVGSGPYRFGEYVEYSHCLLYANHPLSDVLGVVSPSGYFRYTPLDVDVHVSDPPELAYKSKLPYGPTTFTISGYVDSHLALKPLEVNATVKVDGEVVIDITPFHHEPCSGPQWYFNISGTFDFLWVGYSYLHWKGPVMVDDPVQWGHWNLYKTFTFTANTTVIITLDGESYTIEAGLTVTVEIELSFLAPVCIPAEPCTMILHDIEWWQMTIKEDIAGSNWYDDVGVEHPYATQLPTCDYKVNMRDIGAAARAFGSYPGHERWSTTADITGPGGPVDYRVDMRDIGAIARKFGWIG